MRPLLMLLPAALMLLSSCASPIHDTGFLKGGYEQFNVIDDTELKLRIGDLATWGEPVLVAHEDNELTIRQGEDEFSIQQVSTAQDNFKDLISEHPVVFVVSEPRWLVDNPYPEEPQRSDKITFTIRERLYRYLLRSYEHPTRVRYAYSKNDPQVHEHRVVTITSNITWLDKGIGFTRYFLGWGIGQASLQIEGEIFEGFPENGKKIGEYAVRASHGGFAQNGINVKVLKSDYCLLYAAEEAIGMVTEELPQYLPGVNYRVHGDLRQVVEASIARPETSVVVAPAP